MPTLDVITLAGDTAWFHMGSPSLSLCLTVLGHKYCFSSAEKVFLVRKKGSKIVKFYE